MDQESLVQIQGIVSAATESLRADIAEARRDTNVLRQELRTEIADAKRHAGVLTEGLRHELQLVAEGLQLHVSERHAEERTHMDEQFRETRALLQLSYGQVQDRVERLEQRVRHLTRPSLRTPRRALFPSEQHLGPLPE
ncbi:MAG: hypothetical protein GDA67_06850 [Nitrospira sp. CR1.3]|nr:hypothetical protein [Nitrospira sp. CR1.3]